MLQTSNLIPTVTIATVLAVIGLTYTYYRRRISIPKQWTPVGKVKQLFIYPLKSGRRREIKSAKCNILGASIEENNVELRDRSFVVYDEANYELKTARTHPKLILIEVSAGSNGDIIFRAPGQNQLNVKIPSANDKRIPVKLLRDEPCQGFDCGDEAAAWLSQYIENKPSGYRLCYHSTDYKRDIMKQHPAYNVYKTLGNDSAGSFQDLTSYNLINQASVESLNTNLEDKVSANNFRPNILVEGVDLQAFAEEEWDWIKIGDAIFRNVKPCTRCILTTVNPEIGVLSKQREPLKTIEKTHVLTNPVQMKAERSQAVMGVHLGLKRVGEMNIGDVVYVG